VSLSVSCFVTAVVSTSHAGFVVFVLVLRCAAQDGKVLEEARTTLATEEIRTPSEASPETCDAEDEDEEVAATSGAASISEPTIIGEEYGQSRLESCSSVDAASVRVDLLRGAVDARTRRTRKSRRSQLPPPPNSVQAATKKTVLSPSTVPPLTITLRYVLLTQPSGSISLLCLYNSRIV
jgi:hypothetical protein